MLYFSLNRNRRTYFPCHVFLKSPRTNVTEMLEAHSNSSFFPLGHRDSSWYTYCPRMEFFLQVTLLQWGIRKGFDTSFKHIFGRIIHTHIITSTLISTYTTTTSLYSNVIENPDFSKEIITDYWLTIILRSQKQTRQKMAQISDPFHISSNNLIIRTNVFKAQN